MTADEIVFAVGKYNTNASVWYCYNAASTPTSITGSSSWWTMSPNYFLNDSYMFTVYSNIGQLVYDKAVNYSEVRPVLSLKSSVLWDLGT